MIEQQKRLWIGVDGHDTWLRELGHHGVVLRNDGALNDAQVETLKNRDAFKEAFPTYSRVVPFYGYAPSFADHTARALANPTSLFDQKSETFMVDSRLYSHRFDRSQTEGAEILSNLPNDQVRITFQSAMLGGLENWLRGRFMHYYLPDGSRHVNRWELLYKEKPAILRANESVSPLASKVFSTGEIHHSAREEYRNTGVDYEVRVVDDSMNAAIYISRIFEIPVHLVVSEEEAMAQPRSSLPESLRRGFDDIHFAPKGLIIPNSGMNAIAREIILGNRREEGQNFQFA